MSQNKYTPFDFKYYQDKNTIFEFYCKYMLTRTQSMFVYENLPDSIPVQWLEYYLQRNGSCCIAEVKGKLYALIGSAGGELDAYYQPTIYTVANPALDLSATFTIGTDCVYARNDFTAIGLVPLLARYCGLMTENVLTIRQSDISMRNMFLLSAPDDNTFQSTKQFLTDLEDGKLGAIADNPFFDGIKMQSSSHGTGDYMIQFIELQQYLKGSLYNELGLNANFNMKREALSGDEIAMNDDALMPLIDDMLKQRRQMCSDLNDMFGLDVSVDYGSTWHSNVVEKQQVADAEFGANPDEAEEMAGDESNLPDDDSAQDVSQLNDATDSEQESNDDPKQQEKPDNPEDSESHDNDLRKEVDDESAENQQQKKPEDSGSDESEDSGSDESDQSNDEEKSDDTSDKSDDTSDKSVESESEDKEEPESKDDDPTPTDEQKSEDKTSDEDSDEDKKKKGDDDDDDT